ncbi:unnamed protein product [Protopolystoma xenopodis]|uniref:Uncharacterized protein n=1 Tax=Protopolystoma xenopodis TaxID=117903 RepID=A0A448X054_9PLAT|nr:unnamed protein product [Protopolystoma xenopodis]
MHRFSLELQKEMAEFGSAALISGSGTGSRQDSTRNKELENLVPARSWKLDSLGALPLSGAKWVAVEVKSKSILKLKSDVGEEGVDIEVDPNCKKI